MRVLFVSNLYPPNVIGGYERLCFEVAAALAKRGHDVWVLTSDHVGRVQVAHEQHAHQTQSRSTTAKASSESIRLRSRLAPAGSPRRR